MRTTLNLEDDIFIATKNMARREGKSIGDVLSTLVRYALQNPELVHKQASSKLKPHTNLDAELIKLGVVPYYAPNGKTVTNEFVNKLREEAGV